MRHQSAYIWIWRFSVLAALIWIGWQQQEIHASMPESSLSAIDSLASKVQTLTDNVEEIRSVADDIEILVGNCAQE